MKYIRPVFIILLFSTVTSASSIVHLFNFQGSYQGWELTEGSAYGDRHLCGDALASWIGWDFPSWQEAGEALPAWTPLTFQYNHPFSLPNALELWADITFYSLPEGVWLPLTAQMFITTQSNSGEMTTYYTDWQLLYSHLVNKLALPTAGIPYLDNIQSIGISFRTYWDFRGKVCVEDVWARLETTHTPEPGTWITLLSGIGILSIGSLVRQKRRARNKDK